MEFAGSLGDLGTLLPIAIGMIMINGLNPMGFIFFRDYILELRFRFNP
jgi:SulP family sulfate permease